MLEHDNQQGRRERRRPVNLQDKYGPKGDFATLQRMLRPIPVYETTRRPRLHAAEGLVATAIAVSSVTGVTAASGIEAVDRTVGIENVAEGVSLTPEMFRIATIIDSEGSLQDILRDITYGPETYGQITIPEGQKTAVIAVGDSLAWGKGSNQLVVEGHSVHDSWPTAFVAKVNEISDNPSTAEHVYFPPLAQNGETAKEFLEVLREHADEVAKIPNQHLILGATLIANDLKDAARKIETLDEHPSVNDLKDAAKEQGVLGAHSYKKEVMEVFAEKLEQYAKTLEEVRRTLDYIQQQRQKMLGKDSTFTFVALGLPRLTDVQGISDVITNKKANPGEVTAIQNIYDIIMRNSMIAGDDEQSGIKYVYINMGDTPIDPKKDLWPVDHYHPSETGYAKFARVMAGAVNIQRVEDVAASRNADRKSFSGGQLVYGLESEGQTEKKSTK